MKLNNKGFTLIEILAVITIIAILTSIAVVSLANYKEKAKKLDYDALARSAYAAFDNYRMDHRMSSSISLNELAEENYLESVKDPADSEKDCYGNVIYMSEENDSKEVETTEVYLCCNVVFKKYTYSSKNGNKVETLSNDSLCK